jgi:hypothetical protein
VEQAHLFAARARRDFERRMQGLVALIEAIAVNA